MRPFRTSPAGSVRLARLGIGIAGTAIGAACLLAPGLTARAAGLTAGPEVVWLFRLFGVRDLCLGLAFLSTADRRNLRLLGGMMAFVQAGDLTVSTVAAARGRLTRRALAAVWLGAPPTVAMAMRLIR